MNDDEGNAVSAASIQVQVPFKNSATAKYMLAHTITDRNGRYVLAFGTLRFATSEMKSLQATFRVMPTSLYQQPETAQTITIQLPVTPLLWDETAGEQDDWLRPNALRLINFVVQPK